MWKSVFDSVAGTSHAGSGQPCQDACRVVQAESGGQPLLIACVADGAGSATHSDAGAEIACDRFIEMLTEQPLLLDEADIDVSALAEMWLGEIREAIVARAAELEVPPRQLACTFLAAVIGAEHALFLQIGDGAIVRHSEEGYATVFWPQSGEYANTTNFVTDDQYEDNVVATLLHERIDELAMFTDGLERLILKFDDQSVHAPFLTPLFAALRKAENPEDYFAPLRGFLSSKAVNDRTDDDKTLILATRIE